MKADVVIATEGEIAPPLRNTLVNKMPTGKWIG